MHKDGSIQTNLKDMTLDDLRDLAQGNDKQVIQHKFIPLTPGNIDSLSEEEVLALVEDKPGLPNKKARLQIIKMVYEILGFTLSNDALLCLLSENHAQLCLATAGGGKTTFSQVKIVLEKLWRKSIIDPKRNIDGRNILCLVYNKHNRRDMLEKQRTFATKINLATSTATNIDTNINALTMHAFCNLWGNTYAMQMGFINFNLAKESGIESMMTTAISVACKKFNEDSRLVNDVDNFIQLYNYQRETMMDLAQLTQTDKFLDVGKSVPFVELVFKLFNSLKQSRRLYDFTDMLLSFYNLISTNKDILNEIRSYYDYIVADEVQDFTPIMWKILRLISGDDIPLLCIGDEDQNIYSFRGADIYDTLYFKERFSDAETFLLTRNRRCREKILDVAKSVISKNSLRFSKEIQGVKPGGNVELIKYTQQQGAYFNLLSKVKKMKQQELGSTVITYREKDTSAIFIDYLANSGVPFYVISGYTPFSHELYKHLFNVLDLLLMPGDSLCLLNLYKVLPIKKAENYKLLDYNPKTFSFGPKYIRNVFSKLDYGKFYSYNNFGTVMQDLTNISDNIETAPMKSYFRKLFSYIDMYFWKFKKKLNDNPIDDLFEVFIYELFNSDLTYPEFSEEIIKRKELLSRYSEMQTGLAVSTLHGLKGLEFDNVIIVNMDDELFPNYPLIESKEYPEDTELTLKEAERRLFYVAITRARNNLTIYYNEDNPSIFIKDVREGLEEYDRNNGTAKSSLQSEDSQSEILDGGHARVESRLSSDHVSALAKTSSNESTGKAVEVSSPLMGMDLFSKENSEAVEDNVVNINEDLNGTSTQSTTEVSACDLAQTSTVEERSDVNTSNDTGLLSFDDDDDDNEVTFYLYEDGNFRMEGVLDNLTSEHATDDINKAKTNIEYKEEIKEEIKDVTTVQLGNAMQEITKQTSVQANDLPKMHLEELNKDKKDFKSKDSYISRLFSNYGA